MITAEKPLISIIMSVFDTPDDWLVQSIESILQQTYENLEFIIIDDCCKKSNQDILEQFKRQDQRIILLKNDDNLGLTKSLNKGLKVARGSFIARIDADDISLPDRIERQLECFQKNNHLAICGTNFWALIGSQRHPYKVPLGSSKSLKCMLSWKDVFVHPSVMINADIIRRYNLFYDETFKTAQDYELWCRIRNYGDLMNIPNRLCVYRVHENQISSKTSNQQAYNRNRIILKNLKHIGIFCNEERLNIMLAIMGYENRNIKPYLIIKELLSLCHKMYAFYGLSSLDSIREFLWNTFWVFKHHIFYALQNKSVHNK